MLVFDQIGIGDYWMIGGYGICCFFGQEGCGSFFGCGDVEVGVCDQWGVCGLMDVLDECICWFGVQDVDECELQWCEVFSDGGVGCEYVGVVFFEDVLDVVLWRQVDVGVVGVDGFGDCMCYFDCEVCVVFW